MTQPNPTAQPTATPPSEEAPTAAPAPTEAPAQGAAPPAIDVANLAAQITEQVKNGVFADLRRAGLLGNKEKSAPPPPKPIDATSQQADHGRLRALDRAVARSPHASRLNDAAYTRLERAFVEESPSDAGMWLADYFESLGMTAPPPAVAAPAAPPTVAAPAAPTAAPAPKTTNPVSSGGGSPPAPSIPLEEQDLLSLSKEDRAFLINQKGPRWWTQTLSAQQRGKSLRIR